MLRGRKEFLEEEESSQALTTGKMLPCEEHSSGVRVQRICAGGLARADNLCRAKEGEDTGILVGSFLPKRLIKEFRGLF